MRGVGLPQDGDRGVGIPSRRRGLFYWRVCLSEPACSGGELFELRPAGVSLSVMGSGKAIPAACLSRMLAHRMAWSGAFMDEAR
jgi:hypothetical protein